MRTLQQASGFMFLGPNRFAGYLGPEYAAGLDAPKCSIAFLLDRIAIDASNRRQMKSDNGRTKVGVTGWQSGVCVRGVRVAGRGQCPI